MQSSTTQTKNTSSKGDEKCNAENAANAENTNRQKEFGIRDLFPPGAYCKLGLLPSVFAEKEENTVDATGNPKSSNDKDKVASKVKPPKLS